MTTYEEFSKQYQELNKELVAEIKQLEKELKADGYGSAYIKKFINGFLEGYVGNRMYVARKLLEHGVSVDVINRCTYVPIEELERMKTK